MLTTDTIVYPCEQNQNRYENGLDLWTQAKLCSRIKTAFTGLQFGTWVNVASGEFRGSSYDNNFLSDKNFWLYLRPEIS